MKMKNMEKVDGGEDKWDHNDKIKDEVDNKNDNDEGSTSSMNVQAYTGYGMSMIFICRIQYLIILSTVSEVLFQYLKYHLIITARMIFFANNSCNLI